MDTSNAGMVIGLLWRCSEHHTMENWVWPLRFKGRWAPWPVFTGWKLILVRSTVSSTTLLSICQIRSFVTSGCVLLSDSISTAAGLTWWESQNAKYLSARRCKAMEPWKGTSPAKLKLYQIWWFQHINSKMATFFILCAHFSLITLLKFSLAPFGLKFWMLEWPLGVILSRVLHPEGNMLASISTVHLLSTCPLLELGYQDLQS